MISYLILSVKHEEGVGKTKKGFRVEKKQQDVTYWVLLQKVGTWRLIGTRRLGEFRLLKLCTK